MCLARQCDIANVRQSLLYYSRRSSGINDRFPNRYVIRASIKSTSDRWPTAPSHIASAFPFLSDFCRRKRIASRNENHSWSFLWIRPWVRCEVSACCARPLFNKYHVKRSPRLVSAVTRVIFVIIVIRSGRFGWDRGWAMDANDVVGGFAEWWSMMAVVFGGGSAESRIRWFDGSIRRFDCNSTQNEKCKVVYLCWVVRCVGCRRRRRRPRPRPRPRRGWWGCATCGSCPAPRTPTAGRWGGGGGRCRPPPRCSTPSRSVWMSSRSRFSTPLHLLTSNIHTHTHNIPTIRSFTHFTFVSTNIQLLLTTPRMETHSFENGNFYYTVCVGNSATYIYFYFGKKYVFYIPNMCRK